ncbi:unnamed protein product [Boreogadus saida]
MRQNKDKVVEIVHLSHLQVETSGVGVLKSVFTVVLSENVILNVLNTTRTGFHCLSHCSYLGWWCLVVIRITLMRETQHCGEIGGELSLSSPFNLLCDSSRYSADCWGGRCESDNISEKAIL